MKKIIFALSALSLLIVSCSREIETDNPQSSKEGSVVLITFDKAGGQYNTRAFFDNTFEAEPYEKEIKSAMIYVCDQQGRMVMRKELSAPDIANLSTNLVLPQDVVGQECTFYALANNKYYPAMNETETDLLKNSDATSTYNGAFGEVSTGFRRTYGFAMSASKKAVVQPKGTPTSVSFVMKRTVAKIAVRVSVEEKFAAQLGKAKIFVKNITISKAPSAMWLFLRPSDAVIPMNYVFTQESTPFGDDYGNLFYIPETLPLSQAERVTLGIDALFDQDGNIYSTDDQFALGWDIKIDGTGNGEILRNGYYRISAVINGIDSSKDVMAFIAAAEWESPVTQPVSHLN